MHNLIILLLHGRTNSDIIKLDPEKRLRLIYGDKQSSYDELLTRDNPVSIHQGNIQILATEMFNIKNEMPPEIISDIFTKRADTCYSPQNTNYFRIPSVNTVHNRTGSISFLGRKI